MDEWLRTIVIDILEHQPTRATMPIAPTWSHRVPRRVRDDAVLSSIRGAVVGWLVGGQTLLQQSVTDRYRGRLYGAYGTTSALTRLSGMGLASIAGDRVGVVPLLTAAGGLHIAAAVGRSSCSARRPRRTRRPMGSRSSPGRCDVRQGREVSALTAPLSPSCPLAAVASPTIMACSLAATRC